VPGPGGPTASAAPQPSFPPVASYYPPAPSIATQPIRLLPPEQPAAGLSESSSSPAAAAPASQPVGIPRFAPAIGDRVANGRKPTLEGLDWLRTNGYKSVVFLRHSGQSDDGDRKQFEQRGLTFVSVEAEPATLSWATVEAFARLVDNAASQPLFVYDIDGSLTGGLWYLYFRRIEHLSDDVARLQAGRLGWDDTAAEAPHREMADAAKRLVG
jgi:hypothetical protein